MMWGLVVNSNYKILIAEIDKKIAELKKKKIFSDEIAELSLLRELLVEQNPYENISNPTR